MLRHFFTLSEKKLFLHNKSEEQPKTGTGNKGIIRSRYAAGVSYKI